MKLIYRKYLTTVALIWAGCFILFFFAYMLFLSPQNKTQKRVENELAKKKQEHQFALKAAQEETRIALKEQIEQLQERLRDFVINFGDSANLIFDIGQIASEKKIASFSIGSKDKRGISAIPDCNYIGESYIDISFTGQFDQFVSFLNALERHRPVIFVDGFTIVSSRQQEESGHRVNLNVMVFVKK